MVEGPATAIVTGSSGKVTYSYPGVLPTVYATNPTAPTNARTYKVITSIAADADYNGATSMALAFTIEKATAIIAVTPYNVAYDANPHTATFTAVGVETSPADLSIDGCKRNNTNQ